MYQSTEVARAQEILIQGSWYANLRDDEQGGIAVMVYHGDIATLFLDHVYFSEASASWLEEAYSSGVWIYQRSPVEEL